jgi:SAM-dependent methyltransferase
MIESRGALLDAGDRPAARRWGHPERHRVGDLQKVGALYPSGYFDVALINGVFGWGLDTLDGQNDAVEGLARVLKPAGILMLAWNTDRSSDPTKLLAIERFFVPRSARALSGESWFRESRTFTISCRVTTAKLGVLNQVLNLWSSQEKPDAL